MATEFAVDLVFRNQTRGIDEIERKLGGLEQKINGIPKKPIDPVSPKAVPKVERLRRSLTSLQGAMAAIGALAIGRVFAGIATEASSAERQLRFATKATGDYAVASEAVARGQKELALTSTQAKAGVAGFYQALRPLGVETEAIEDSFIGFNKLLRRGGVEAAQAAGAYTQLKQAFAAGTLSGDEFRSLRDVPGFLQALADATGKPISALKEMGSEGQITSEILVKTFQALADSSVPPLNAIERLRGVWDQFAIDVA